MIKTSKDFLHLVVLADISNFVLNALRLGSVVTCWGRDVYSSELKHSGVTLLSNEVKLRSSLETLCRKLLLDWQIRFLSPTSYTHLMFPFNSNLQKPASKLNFQVWTNLCIPFGSGNTLIHRISH